jgi:hypothetical protein
MYSSYLNFVTNFFYNTKIFSRKKKVGKYGMNANNFTVTKLSCMYKDGLFKIFMPTDGFLLRNFVSVWR